MSFPITPLDAVVLGLVEGLTEFLPVSSTGHLILTSRLLGLDGPATSESVKLGVDAYNIVIQAGALLAVIGLYRLHVARMLNGLLGRDPAGLRLGLQLIVAFLPAAITGKLFNKAIKAHLMGDGPWGHWPVVLALIGGGVAMIAVEQWRNRRVAARTTADGMLRADLETPGRAYGHLSLEQMTWMMALGIGLAQCLAMWPGTSRSMVTIVAALLMGFSPAAAAEFSFLLALPTLGAATVYEFHKDHAQIALAAGHSSLAIGFVVSCIVAWIAVKGFIHYVNLRGLTPFGIYRVAIGTIFAIYFATVGR